MGDNDGEEDDVEGERRESDDFVDAAGEEDAGTAVMPAINRRDSLSDFRACNNLLALGNSFDAAVEMILSPVSYNPKED